MSEELDGSSGVGSKVGCERRCLHSGKQSVCQRPVVRTNRKTRREEEKITDSLSDSVSAFVNIQYVASA